MQVHNHLVSLYVATCGQNGPGLGSDEKEITLLVYHVIEPTNAQIIGQKKILVRPSGALNKESANSEAVSPSSSCLHVANSCSKSDNNDEGTTIPALGSLSSSKALNNIGNTRNSPNGAAILPSPENTDLTIARTHVADMPLNEAIEEFDQYLRNLFRNNEQMIQNIQFITEGQLPLRQCLHREACVKDITLPSYYNHFCDLRKAYAWHKSGDLSRALVPLHDIKKLLQLPSAQTTPQSISEMLSDLNLTSSEDVDYFMREARDMVSIIQFLLKAGYTFHANEIVNLCLEPGICSINEEIDNNCIVRARGLPWQSSDQDIAKFFRGLNVAKGGVALCLSPLGRRNGEALIRFVCQEHRDMALKRHKHHIGNRYIEVYRATGDEFLAVAGGASNEAQAFLSKGAQVIIRMRGLPYDCTVKQVLDFFNTGESHCEVLDGPEGVLFVKKHDGRSTGDAFVLFANEADAPRALSRHRESIGQRYIELFRSTTAEVQQVLNRSLDPKTYEISQQPPLIAQLPTVPLSLLPQHFITSGTTKNCIRLRGLPYEALVENILHFLDDFAKHIIYQGVHMVINAQGQPSGEAFIQMDSEESARLCAQRKHNQFMVFGKKYRYIEVFQCSGADMYLVLNGGLQSLGTATGIHYPHPHSAHTAGKQPSLLPPGMLKQTSSVSAQTINSTQHRNHPSHITSTHIPSSHTMPPALQPTMSTDAAALSQSAHSPTHLPLAAPPTAVQPNAQSAMLASIMSAQNSVQPVTGAPHPSALVPSSIQQNLSVGGSLGNLHTASTLSMAPPANPNLAFNLPPPQNSAAVTASVHNSALFAQQQAQFIAQQTLLARQQAAAAVAAQHHQQQQQLYFAANLMNPILMQHTAATLNVPQALASPSAAGAQPQFFLMPRPSYFQSFPIEQAMPTLQTYHQFDNAGGSGMLSNAAANVASPSHFSTKRSYEHAFQQDVNAASTAKRAVTRAPTGVYPYFNPGI